MTTRYFGYFFKICGLIGWLNHEVQNITSFFHSLRIHIEVLRWSWVRDYITINLKSFYILLGWKGGFTLWEKAWLNRNAYLKVILPGKVLKNYEIGSLSCTWRIRFQWRRGYWHLRYIQEGHEKILENYEIG